MDSRRFQRGLGRRDVRPADRLVRHRTDRGLPRPRPGAGCDPGGAESNHEAVPWHGRVHHRRERAEYGRPDGEHRWQRQPGSGHRLWAGIRDRHCGNEQGDGFSGRRRGAGKNGCRAPEQAALRLQNALRGDGRLRRLQERRLHLQPDPHHPQRQSPRADQIYPGRGRSGL